MPVRLMDSCDLCLEKFPVNKLAKCQNHEICRSLRCPRCRKCSLDCADRLELHEASIKYRNQIEESEEKIAEIKNRLRSMERSRKLNRCQQNRLDVREHMDTKWVKGSVTSFPDFDNWNINYFL